MGINCDVNTIVGVYKEFNNLGFKGILIDENLPWLFTKAYFMTTQYLRKSYLLFIGYDFIN